jgi:hypothetical protein
VLDVIEEHILSWASGKVGADFTQIDKAFGGKNNKAFRLQCDEGQFFLKQYFSYSDPDGSRFKREYEFYSLLNKHDIRDIATLVASDQRYGVALFSHISGTPIEFCSLDDILQSADFIRRINVPAICLSAKNIEYARGGLSSPMFFLDDINGRLRILNELESDKDIYDELKVYLNEDVKPLLEILKSRWKGFFASDNKFDQVLSPSDFGFHNVLRDQHLYFFDFEYAGWDSAEKLVTDFFCQPRYQIDKALMPNFIEVAFPEPIRQRLLGNCRKLVDLVTVKWALIFLNEFKSNDMRRRVFSGEQNCDDYLRRQLEKSKRKLFEVEV